MPVKQWLILSKSSLFSATILAGMISSMQTDGAKAEDFNTGYVLRKMPVEQQTVHIDGLVRGVAFSSYFLKNKNNEAFECILDYAATGDVDKWQSMLDFAQNHQDKAMGGVLFVYLRKKCRL